MQRPSMQIGLGLALGIGIGLAFALFLGTGGAWLGVGIAIGITIGAVMWKREAPSPRLEAVRNDRRFRSHPTKIA